MLFLAPGDVRKGRVEPIFWMQTCRAFAERDMQRLGDLVTEEMAQTYALFGSADEVVPLAYRNTTPTLPAAAADTVHCMVAPDALAVLQNPVPENPAWLLSMVPWQVPFSASKRVPGGGGGVVVQSSVEPVALTRDVPLLATQ